MLDGTSVSVSLYGTKTLVLMEDALHLFEDLNAIFEGVGKKISKDYAIKTPIQQVVCWFKVRKGVKLEDRDWDAVYYRRYSRPAKELLTLFGGSVDAVMNCIDAVVSALEAKRLSWTPETVVKHAGDWKNGRLLK